MYRARDQVANEEWLTELRDAAEVLDLSDAARTRATDLFLSTVSAAPGSQDRSKRAVVAASLYAGALIAGEERSQNAVADATDVSRLTVQQRWKDLLDEAGLEPPGW